MSLRLLLGIIILFISLGIAYFLPGYNSILALISIFIISIFTIFGLLNSSVLALMQANMKMEFSLISSIIWKLSNLFIIICIIYFLFPQGSIDNFDFAFIWIMIAWFIWIFLNTLLNYIYARKICPIHFKWDTEYIKHIFKISLPYGIALFLSVVYFKVDIILLSLLETPEKWDISIALYSLPMKIIEVLMVLAWFYMNSILPTLTQMFEDKKETDANSIIRTSFKLLFSFALGIFILGVLFKNHIIEIISNKSYLFPPNHDYSSADVFVIVLGVIIVYFLSLLFIYIFIAAKKQSTLLKINIFVTLLNIIWNIILIPKYSFVWAWIITLISQIVLMIICYFWSKKILSFSIPWIYIIKAIWTALCCIIIGYFLLSFFSFWLFYDLILIWIPLGVIYFSISTRQILKETNLVQLNR